VYKEDFSRKGAKAQSAAAFPKGLSLRLYAFAPSPLRLCAFAREISLKEFDS